MWWSSPSPLSVCAELLPAYVSCVLVSVLCIRLCVWTRKAELLPPLLTRKAMHILTGPAFCLMFTTFPRDQQMQLQPHPYSATAEGGGDSGRQGKVEEEEGSSALVVAAAARWSPLLASTIPLLSTLYFLAVGSGWWRDEGLVSAVARRGDRSELLRGPLVYGLVHCWCALRYWTASPVGVFLILSLCLGDGSADVAGRWTQRHRPALHRPLPWNARKTMAGSAAMLVASLAGQVAFALLFHSLDVFPAPCALLPLVRCAAVMSLVATAVESLPIADWDNLTITAAAAIAAHYTASCTSTCSA